MSSLTTTSSAAPMCDINTTPLVDVMLVLLIIFMITAPMVNHQSKVQIPLVGRPGAVLEPPPLLQLSLDANGNYRLDDQAISLLEITELAKRSSGQNPVPQFNLRIDPATPYPLAVKLIATLKSNGASNIRFAELSPRLQ